MFDVGCWMLDVGCLIFGYSDIPCLLQGEGISDLLRGIRMEEKEKSSENFKFSADEERPTSLFNVKREQTLRENHRTDILSRRITIISLLFFCMLVLVIFVGYLHMEKQFSQIRNTETSETRKLSQELESKLVSLSAEYAKLEDSLTRKVSPVDEVLSDFEKTIVSLKNDLKKLKKSLNADKKSKVGDKELKAAIGKMENMLEPLRKDVEKISGKITSLDKRFSEELAKKHGAGTTNTEAAGSEIKSLENKFSEELAKIAGAVDNVKDELDTTNKDFNKLRSDISTLLSETADTQTLDKKIKEQDSRTKENLILINGNLDHKEKKIKAIQRKLEKIEKRLESTEKRTRNKAPKSSSDDIIEQDIQ